MVAKASRALAVAGLFDHNGHISVRDRERIVINGRQASRISVRVDQVADVRLSDGAVIGDVEPPSETPLHVAVYRARSDVGSVAHFHPLYATAFAVAGRPLATAFCAGAPFGREVPVFDHPELIQDDDWGRDVAGALGDARALLLRGHGVVVAGEDLVSCVAASIFLEESARRLAVAAGLGEPRRFSDDEVRRVRGQIWRRSVIEKAWINALERARRDGALDDLEP